MKKNFINKGVILGMALIFGTSTVLGETVSNNKITNIASYSSDYEISESTSTKGVNYSSSKGGQNAILVSGGKSTLTDANVVKNGDETSTNSDVYGTNAAILIYNGATLNVVNGSITTNGIHASGLFAYDKGIINVKNATIKTSSNYSAGLVVGGGVITAKNLNVETAGSYSPALKSTKEGGSITVTGGVYKTTGTDSPAIYSEADITVVDANLTATASRGVVVNGANKVNLKNSKLKSTDMTLEEGETEYKNILLYQSEDVKKGITYFTAKDGAINTNKGSTLYVSNTNAVVELRNNSITNSNGDFLHAESSIWGTEGTNGANVNLTLSYQTVTGNIVIDKLSSLDMTMEDGSKYKGTINGDNAASEVTLTLSKNSTVVLTGDSYVDKLTNVDDDNSNIYLNGHKLYVNGVAVSANEGASPRVIEGEKDEGTNLFTIISAGVILMVVIVALGLALIKNRKAN